MNTDNENEYLITGDVDGTIKVWVIADYCLKESEEKLVTDPPREPSHVFINKL